MTTIRELIDLLIEVEDQCGDIEVPVNIAYQPDYPIKQEVAYLSIHEGELYIIGGDSSYASRKVFDDVMEV